MTHNLFCEPKDLRNAFIQTSNASSDAPPRNVLWVEADCNKTSSLDKTAAIEREGLGQRVRLFLAGSNIPALRRVDVEIDGDAVLLRGKVRSYYEKQMALQLASRVAGVIRVIDLIEVRTHVPLAKMRRVNPPNNRTAAQAS